MGLDHTVYISLKRLNNADDEWDTGLLHAGGLDQLDNGLHSEGVYHCIVSVHLSSVLRVN